MRMTNEKAEWKKLTEAAQEIGVSASKLSGMAANKEITTRRDPRDKRVVLVDMNELRRLFEMS